LNRRIANGRLLYFRVLGEWPLPISSTVSNGQGAVVQVHQPRIRLPHRPPSATPLFPSDPPSEGGSPGVVRSRCPTTAAFWPASLATGPAGLPQRGVSAGFREANLLALRRANGRASGEPSARRAGEAGALLWVLSCRAARKYLARRGESRHLPRLNGIPTSTGIMEN
jgi:hypothetical protein